MYIHALNDWPNFRWDKQNLANLLAETRYLQGLLLGRMKTLGFELREESTLEVLTQDVLKTSEIEGEKLDALQVRSSVAKQLGIDIGSVIHIDRNVDGIVEVMLNATRNYEALLTQDRLFGWHAALFPSNKVGLQKITVGEWRPESSGVMQVVSGAYGREKVHYEAPSYDRLEKEMTLFIDWFNAPCENDLIIQSALAHFWFVTIHPFDDGNGRIARAIADMVLARSEKSKQRFYSMSTQIQRERNNYYEILESCQKGSLDITLWLEWYLNCLKKAILSSEEIVNKVLIKEKFWRKHAGVSFNERERKVIARLLEKFEGKLTSSKWAKLTKCSQDTALRDITDLLDKKILIKEEGGGRSTSYKLCLPK